MCAIFVRLIMAGQEVLFDKLEQEITPSSTDAEEKRKTRKGYTTFPRRTKIASLRAQLGLEIPKLLHPFSHHCQQHLTSAGTTPNNGASSCVRLHTTAKNIQYLLEQLPTMLEVVASVCT